MSFTSKKLRGAVLLSTMSLVLGLLVGNAFADLSVHGNIILRGPDGAPITSADGVVDGVTVANAYSAKATCGACHDYDAIEQHSYHTQLASNEHYGWDPMNPDGDDWEKGAGPKGKAWVQGQGHVGAW
jgi:hypothetical protein